MIVLKNYIPPSPYPVVQNYFLTILLLYNDEGTYGNRVNNINIVLYLTTEILKKGTCTCMKSLVLFDWTLKKNK